MQQSYSTNFQRRKGKKESKGGEHEGKHGDGGKTKGEKDYKLTYEVSKPSEDLMRSKIVSHPFNIYRPRERE